MFTHDNRVFNSTEELTEYMGYNKFVADYTPFYTALIICSILVTILLLVNWICCCCHPYKQYWSDPDTGNRFASFIFVRSAKQKPLDALY